MPRVRHYVGPAWPPSDGAYDYALALCRSDLAWEFLRRAPAYQRDYLLNYKGVADVPRCLRGQPQLTRIRRRQRAASAWGLVAFVDPALPAQKSPICWLAAPTAPLLDGLAEYAPNDDPPDLWVKNLTGCHVVLGPSGEQFILLRDAHYAVTLRLKGSRVAAAPVNTSILLRGLPDARTFAKTLNSLAALVLHPNYDRHESRDLFFLRDALVAIDGHCLGATYREMAAAVYGQLRTEAAWSSASRWMKDRMCRALAKGERLRDGGYRKLLDQA